MIPTTKQAYRLFHEAALALAEIERNGIAINEKYCKEQQVKNLRMIDRIQNRLMSSKEVQLWKRKFGGKFNINSGDQLANIVFDELGHKAVILTDSGKPSTSEEALSTVNIPIVQDLLKMKQLSKMNSTYIANFEREAVNGFIHPFFNLNEVITYRSSSQNPNFQNIPNRISWMRDMCRTAIVPRPGRMLGGVDYGGIEVKIAACYHQDPTMLSYLEDKSKDMHRDTAADCYLLDPKQVTKQIRYCGKNKFVFPQFYGDWWKSCAAQLWAAITQLELVLEDGTPLKEHLASKGIRSLKKFEKHIEEVERIFWLERFPIYTKWKKDWLEAYQKQGYFITKTGFKCSGIMGKNDVINYPVQGAAFHCLLWSLIRCLQWIKDNRFQSLIVGQIHDEIVLDAVPRELKKMLPAFETIMCHDIRKDWDWIITPLEIEAEFTEPDHSWNEKKPIYPN